MFKIVSDGGCDFTPEEVQKHDVGIVPFYVTLDQENYLKEGVDISKEEFFKHMQEDKDLFPKTSQPNPQDYADAYRPQLEAGKDIISLTISSKVSGTYNSATLAADLMHEEFPDRKIMVIDSLNAAMGQNLILHEIIKMRDQGYSLSETAKIAEKVLQTTKTYYTLDTLDYLKKGGRVGPTTALVGGVLGLRPVLHMVDGSVEQLESVRGRKKVLQLMNDGIAAVLKDDIEDVEICIGHILCETDAIAFKENLEKSIDVAITNPIVEVGATIGSHTGPGALAVAYCKKFESFVS